MFCQSSHIRIFPPTVLRDYDVSKIEILNFEDNCVDKISWDYLIDFSLLHTIIFARLSECPCLDVPIDKNVTIKNRCVNFYDETKTVNATA